MHNIHHLHPKFSIITVTYNAGAVLEDTIQSVITQTYKNVEYIIVDGGSKDRTLQIVEQYKEHIHTVISEPDKGLYDAMNKGIKLATGDYLCFLNAGDELHEDDTLQLMVHSITEPTLPDVLYGDTRRTLPAHAPPGSSRKPELEKFQGRHARMSPGFLRTT